MPILTNEKLIERISDVAYDHGHDICYVAAERIKALVGELAAIREAALREAAALCKDYRHVEGVENAILELIGEKK